MNDVAPRFDDEAAAALTASLVAALTASLVGARSYPCEEGDVQRLVARWLEEQGMPASFQPTEGDRPKVISRIGNCSGSPAEFTFTVDPPYWPPWETAADHPLARSAAQAYRAEAGTDPEWRHTGFGDMNLFSEGAGIPTAMIGPKQDNHHQPNEWVHVPSLGASARVLVAVEPEMLPA